MNFDGNKIRKFVKKIRKEAGTNSCHQLAVMIEEVGEYARTLSEGEGKERECEELADLVITAAVMAEMRGYLPQLFLFIDAKMEINLRKNGKKGGKIK